MRRTRAPNNAAVIPAITSPEAEGYYKDRDGLTAGTTPIAADLNIMQEELVALATLKGATLDATGANRDQAAEALAAIKAIEGEDSGLGDGVTSVTTIDDSAAVAAGAVVIDNDTATHGATHVGGFAAAANGASLAGKSAAVASYLSNALGIRSIVVAAGESEAQDDADYSAVIAAGSSGLGIFGGSGASFCALLAVDECTIDTEDGAAADCAIIAGDGCNVVVSTGHTAVNSMVAASLNTNVTTGADGGHQCFAAGCTSCAVTGDDCAVIASNVTTVGATGEKRTAAIGCDTSTAVQATGQVLLASLNCTGNTDDYSVQGGYDATTPGAPTWRIRSNGGHITGDGTVAGGGADFAELLPNGDDAPHAPGRLLVRKGGAVRLAAPGDRIAGFVSVAPTMVGNADDLAWQGRWLRDEWGAYVRDERGDRVLNPAHDRTREHTPRRDRPAEWTCVGLVGQGLIAVDETVRVDDDVVAGADGIGTRGEWIGRGRQVECMEIVQPFDAAKGYAVARCLVA